MRALVSSGEGACSQLSVRSCFSGARSFFLVAVIPYVSLLKLLVVVLACRSRCCRFALYESLSLRARKSKRRRLQAGGGGLFRRSMLRRLAGSFGFVRPFPEPFFYRNGRCTSARKRRVCATIFFLVCHSSFRLVLLRVFLCKSEL